GGSVPSPEAVFSQSEEEGSDGPVGPHARADPERGRPRPARTGPKSWMIVGGSVEPISSQARKTSDERGKEGGEARPFSVIALGCSTPRNDCIPRGIVAEAGSCGCGSYRW